MPQPSPTAPTVTPDAIAAASTTDATADGTIVDIPFVPEHLRQTVKAEIVDDAIIVVGQRQKKRKRTKKAGIGGDGSGEMSSTPAHAKAEPEVIVPYDFASAPNILDDAPDELSELEDGGRAGKRRRSKKGSGGFLWFSPFRVACH